MAKEEWGTKRVCPTTGKRFYDLNRDPIVSPYTGEVVELDTGKSRAITSEKPAKKAAPAAEDDTVVLEDDATPEAEVEIDDDDVLDDNDDDNVSLDDIADVSSDDNDN